MARRVIPLIALAAFLLAGIVRLSGDSTLPSRKPNVILPLLTQFSSKDHFDKILKLLGKEDWLLVAKFRGYAFRLEDGTWIGVRVSLDGKTVYSVSHEDTPLYEAPD
jgi:hypothetical protein